MTRDGMIEEFLHRLPEAQRARFMAFDSPYAIQEYLDEIPYVGEERDRSPLAVMQDGQGHCLDGGLLAAAGMRYLGLPAVIIDLIPEPKTDDDHVLVLYWVDGLVGALAKSNYVGLRFREPVYRSLRELVMSYFEGYFNSEGRKTLRGYTRPVHLGQFDRYNWLWDEAGVARIARHLYGLKSTPLISPAAAARLHPVDARSYQGHTLGTDMEGVFKLK